MPGRPARGDRRRAVDEGSDAVANWSAMKRSTMVLTLISLAAGGCGGAARSAGSGSARPALGPSLAEVLPEELPTSPRCLGMTPDGVSMLVATPSMKRAADDSETRDVQLEFLLLQPLFPKPPIEAPLQLAPWTVEVGDAAAWAALRDEYEPRLIALGMVACEQLEIAARYPYTKVPHAAGEIEIHDFWDEGTVDSSDLSVDEIAAGEASVRPDELGTIFIEAPPRRGLSASTTQYEILKRSGDDDERSEWVYFHRGSRMLVIAIKNSRPDSETFRYQIDHFVF